MRLATLLAAFCLLGVPPDIHASGFRRCPEPRFAELLATRHKLSLTGLFADTRTEKLQPGVRPYHPSFELWSDGATKRRWIWLPPDARIDSSDMNAWQFPEGTKLWKEFSVNGVRIETRMLEKVGPAPQDWLAISFLWQDDRDAIAVPEGVVDARGTSHDIPPARDCMGCHGGVPSRILGFSAIQLSHTAPEEELTLDRLAAAGRLMRNPDSSFEIPGDPLTQEVLGYLHANCGHCHNLHRPARQSRARCFDPQRAFDLSLRVESLASAGATAVFKTAIDKVIVPGKPDRSALFTRTQGRSRTLRPRMPALGAEIVDPHLSDMLRHWIESLSQEE